MAAPIDTKTKAKVVASYALTNSYNKTAKEFGINDHTVKKIITENADLYEQKKDEFVEKASEIIDMAIDKLKKELKKDDIPVNQLTTVIGTLYDKRALAKGESTNNNSITITMSDDVKELSQ